MISKVVFIIKEFIKRIFTKPENVSDTYDARSPAWYNTAIKELHIKEVSGIKHNPRIIEYHKQTSLKAKTDEVAWCSSFVNWCFNRCGIKGTESAAARSWLKWGEPLSSPRKGCVVVFWRVKLTGWQGHVGFYVKEDDNYIYVLGGNQDNEVNIKPYSKDRLLGYRWP